MKGGIGQSKASDTALRSSASFKTISLSCITQAIHDSIICSFTFGEAEASLFKTWSILTKDELPDSGKFEGLSQRSIASSKCWLGW